MNKYCELVIIKNKIGGKKMKKKAIIFLSMLSVFMVSYSASVEENLKSIESKYNEDGVENILNREFNREKNMDVIVSG